MNKIINVTEWLEENKVALSTPPVCNELMHFGQLIIMFVGGGNIREDFHINEGEELFYQLKGEMLLVIEEAGRDLGYQTGYIDVGDGCLRRNELVTIFRYW